MNNEKGNTKAVQLDGAALEAVAGGTYTYDQLFNLGNYDYRTVYVPAGTLLVMQDNPGGGFMPVSYVNGESILVNRFFSQRGYLLAYKNGTYGYVDGSYVR